MKLDWSMRAKEKQLGPRLPANLKRELHSLAKREGRTLSQICEIFVSVGLEAYRSEGPEYLQPLLARRQRAFRVAPHRPEILTPLLRPSENYPTGLDQCRTRSEDIWGGKYTLREAETRELREELVDSYLYQVHSYSWSETNDYGRFLANDDL
jgi:hypothetical protein